MKILIVDIETAPALALVWKFFHEDISPKQVLEHLTILCWACKWLNEDKVFFEWAHKSDEKTLLKKLLPLLAEADAVVGHNLSRFDAARIRGRCLVHGLELPAPYKEIDTYKVATNEFDFGGNSLKYLATVLGCTPKSEHNEFPGFEMWLECLKGNHKAWLEMKRYNLQDIRTTEEVYLKMLPYIRNHPNHGVFAEGDAVMCPKCGSTDSHRRGFARTSVGKFQRFQCNACGGWHRLRFTEYPKGKRLTLAVNVVD